MISAVVGHLVGDYLLQNDWMALRKKQSTPICAIHCAIWATVITLLAWWPLWAWCVLFILHFAQDRTGIVNWWMDAIGQRAFRTGPCSPWSVIVVDNVWHILTIWCVWKIQA